MENMQLQQLMFLQWNKFTHYLEQVKNGFASEHVFNTGALTALRGDLLEYALPFPSNLNGHDGYLHLISRLLNNRLVLSKKLQSIRRHSSNTSEWIPSSLKKINKLDVFFSQLQTDISQNYDDRKKINASAKSSTNISSLFGLPVPQILRNFFPLVLAE